MLKIPKTSREITPRWLENVTQAYCQQFDLVGDGELCAVRIIVSSNAMRDALYRRARRSNATFVIESLSLLQKVTGCLLSAIPLSERYRAHHRLGACCEK